MSPRKGSTSPHLVVAPTFELDLPEAAAFVENFDPRVDPLEVFTVLSEGEEEDPRKRPERRKMRILSGSYSGSLKEFPRDSGPALCGPNP